MNKKYLLLGAATCAFLLADAADAFAQSSRIYFAGYLGLNTFKDQEFSESSTGRTGDFELDNTMSFAGALGIRLNRQLRLEGELSYRNAELTTVDVNGGGTFDTGGELKSTMLFANLYYDFDVPWKIQPYLGGGLGYAWHTGEVNDGSGLLVNTSGDDSSIVWNVAGGLKYRATPELAFTGGYRYIDSMDLGFGSYDIDYSSHEFRLGLEWDLPITR